LKILYKNKAVRERRKNTEKSKQTQKSTKQSKLRVEGEKKGITEEVGEEN
jgi:hypothetical protein